MITCLFQNKSIAIKNRSIQKTIGISEKKAYMVNPEKSYRRVLVSLWNRVARIIGQNIDHLSIDSVIEVAVKRTGLSDFGNTSFLEPLGIIIKSLNASQNLHPFGRFFARQTIINSLCNRLYIENEWSRHPDLKNISITGNLIILGLPRTGTSYLFNLLSCDSNHRCLTNWEAMHPVIPEGKVPFIKRHTPQARRRSSAIEICAQQYLSPSLSTIHEYRVDGPEECTRLFFNEFACQAFDMLFDIPEYRRWLDGYDYLPAIRYHMRQLKLLTKRGSAERWVLKSPYHLPAIDALLNVYPETTIINIHRDPLEVVPSFCSLTAAYRGICNNKLNEKEIGKQAMDFINLSLVRVKTARKKHDSNRFLDVYYTDLVNNPIEVVKNIYKHLGIQVSHETEIRMKAEVNASAKRKGKTHHYSLQQFGLEREDILDRFGQYIDSFNLPK